MNGLDKGLLSIGGKKMVELVLNRFSPQVDEVLISANRNIEHYTQYGYPVLQDEEADFKGPLAGILEGLKQCKHEYLLVVPCDCPLLPLDYASRMLRELEHSNSLLLSATDGKFLQPVFSLFHKQYMQSITEFLASGQYKLGHWLRENHSRRIDFSDSQDNFFNINTPDELFHFNEINDHLSDK